MYDTLLKVTKHNQPEKTLAYNFLIFGVVLRVKGHLYG